MEGSPTYHDLYITTRRIPRTRIFDLPYGLEVNCCRVAGWTLWDMSRETPGTGRIPPSRGLKVAGEYEEAGRGLRLDVAGHVIVDSLSR